MARFSMAFPFARILLASTLVVAETSAAEPEPAANPIADPTPVIRDLEKKMASVRSVYLEFEQERNLKLFNEPLRSEGVMLIERPDRIRWETTSPYQSILLGERRGVAQFEFNDGKWERLRLGFPQMLRRVMDQMAMMHSGQLDALTADYQISVATGAVAVVTLVPKDETVKSLLAALEI